jgi:hypothetical protein
MDETTAPQGAPATTQPDAAAESVMIPKGRFDEVNERRKAAEAELQSLLAEKQAREEAEAAKRGEFETVLEKYKTELSAAKEKASQWDQYQTDRREALISKLTDDDKGLADGLSLAKLEQLVARLSEQKAPAVVAAKPGSSGGSTSLTPDQIREGVAKHGLKFLKENEAILRGR